MTKDSNKDPFAKIREVGTSAPNYSIDTEAIIARLTLWQSLCSFRVARVKRDGFDIEFDTLPKDIDAFVHDLVEFCPDMDGEGIASASDLNELLKFMKANGEKLTPEMEADLAAGEKAENDQDWMDGLKQEIQKKKKVQLWWD